MKATSLLSQGRTQVLVVGGGPVGLLAALRLRQRGVEVRVVDQQSEHRAHSFPVVLHPQSLRLLQDVGVSAALFWRGRPVTRLTVYTEHERRAVLELPKVPGIGAGVLTLPQDGLRQALCNALRERGVNVEYDTRLAMLQQDARSVWGRLVHEEPSRLLLSGYRSEINAFQADFVIGADGYDSTVRSALGIELVNHGKLESFAFFDAPSSRAGHEAHLALSEDYCNSIFPLQGGKARFSFQLGRSLNKVLDASALQDLVMARTPWFTEPVTGCDWSGVAEFRRALASSFGQGRVWLAGEAAHLTGPLGVQSLNVGLDEANDLALRIADALSSPGTPSFGSHYEAHRSRQWRELLGLSESVQPRPDCAEWTRRHLSHLAACLPASEGDLKELLAQLRLSPISSGVSR